MEHVEARELLETAAVEPLGFERLAAGDTPEAASLAAHLAGCPDCAEEYVRLRRASQVIRDAVRSMPSPELRDRTFAFVAAVGRERGAPVVLGTPAARVAPVVQVAATPSPVSLDVARDDRRDRRRLAAWLGSIAAAIAISVVATAAIVGGNAVADERQAAQIAGLARVTSYTNTIAAEDDAVQVPLASTGQAGLSGRLAYSPGTTALVVVADGLTEPSSDLQYRCWVEIGGQRSWIGQMFFGGGLAYWAGDSDAVSGLESGATFGVSLEPAVGDSVAGQPVLVGEL